MPRRNRIYDHTFKREAVLMYGTSVINGAVSGPPAHTRQLLRQCPHGIVFSHAQDRMPLSQATRSPLTTLLQKIYGRDNATGAVCGIYFFESQAALAAFRETELAKTIPSAYEVVEFRPEVYDLLYPLRSERGPFAG